jgi:hypothetical protein
LICCVNKKYIFNLNWEKKMATKKTKKKPKVRTWDIEGYYYDGKDAYTYVRDRKDPRKSKRIKGIAWHQNKDD